MIRCSLKNQHHGKYIQSTPPSLKRQTHINYFPEDGRLIGLNMGLNFKNSEIQKQISCTEKRTVKTWKDSTDSQIRKRRASSIAYSDKAWNTWLSSPNMINMKKNNTAQAWGTGSSAKAAG